jgi:hypothetical protein
MLARIEADGDRLAACLTDYLAYEGDQEMVPIFSGPGSAEYRDLTLALDQWSKHLWRASLPGLSSNAPEGAGQVLELVNQLRRALENVRLGNPQKVAQPLHQTLDLVEHLLTQVEVYVGA